MSVIIIIAETDTGFFIARLDRSLLVTTAAADAEAPTATISLGLAMSSLQSSWALFGRRRQRNVGRNDRRCPRSDRVG
jgi:hypothetical protein